MSQSVWAETTSNPEGKTDSGAVVDYGADLIFDFTPRTPKFSTDLNQARCYGHDLWNKFSYAGRAEYILDLAEKLIKAHQTPNDPNAYGLSARIITCKTFNESTFDTQIKTSDSESSAIGLSQVTEGTMIDFFNRYDKWRSKVPSYGHIDNAADFRKEMAMNPVLQLEMGIAIMEAKRRDNGLSGDSVKPLLEAYYGNADATLNEEYANSIYDCAACAKRNKNVFTIECLCKAKPYDTNCTKHERIVPEPNCK